MTLDLFLQLVVQIILDYRYFFYGLFIVLSIFLDLHVQFTQQIFLLVQRVRLSKGDHRNVKEGKYKDYKKAWHQFEPPSFRLLLHKVIAATDI